MGSTVFVGFQRILVAYDKSPEAEHAITIALSTAERAKAKVFIFSVVQLLEPAERLELEAPLEETQEHHQAPWFRFATVPCMVGSNLRLRSPWAIRGSAGQLLKEELHLYGHALSQWSCQFVSKMEILITSYLEAYRVHLHGITRISNENSNPQLDHDLAFLGSWDDNATPSELQMHG